MNDSPPSGRAQLLAFFSFALGVLSIFFLCLTGLPAIYLGLQSLRAINASDGRVGGRPFAIGGMVLGALATLLSVVGIVAWALMQVNSAATDTACRNNLRVIGMATHSYEVEHNHYPPGTIPNPALPDPQMRLSWLVEILPYIGVEPGSSKRVSPVNDLFESVDTKAAWDDPTNRKAIDKQVRWFECPGHPGYEVRHEPGQTHFVGLAGVGTDSAELPLRRADRTLDPRVGFFGYDRIIKESDIERGTSYTLIASETARDNGPWAAGGTATVRGFDLDDPPYAGKNGQLGGLRDDGAYMLYADASVNFFVDGGLGDLLKRLIPLAKSDGSR